MNLASASWNIFFIEAQIYKEKPLEFHFLTRRILVKGTGEEAIKKFKEMIIKTDPEYGKNNCKIEIKEVRFLGTAETIYGSSSIIDKMDRKPPDEIDK